MLFIVKIRPNMIKDLNKQI